MSQFANVLTKAANQPLDQLFMAQIYRERATQTNLLIGTKAVTRDGTGGLMVVGW
jgi:hypothetical protein